MGYGDTYVAADRGVGEVALQTGDGEFMAEVFEDGIGQTEVAFGILEIDGVHLVGHGRRPHLACLDLLFEILHGDVGPHIATEINEDNIDAFAVVEIGRHVVVVLNLGGVLKAFQS